MNVEQWRLVKSGLEDRYQQVVEACGASDGRHRNAVVEYGDFLADEQWPLLRQHVMERANYYYHTRTKPEVQTLIEEIAQAWTTIVQAVLDRVPADKLDQKSPDGATCREALEATLATIERNRALGFFHELIQPTTDEALKQLEGELLVPESLYNQIRRRRHDDDHAGDGWGKVSFAVDWNAPVLGISARDLCPEEHKAQERCRRKLTHRLEKLWEKGGGLALFKTLCIRRRWHYSESAGSSDVSLVEPSIPLEEVEFDRRICEAFDGDTPTDVLEPLKEAHRALVEWVDGHIAAATGDKTVVDGVEAVETDKKDTEGKLWTEDHCPSCGEPGIEFLSQIEFVRRTQSHGKTLSRGKVGRAVGDGRYWHDLSKKVPWCERCKEKTPEGPGVARPVDAEPAPKYAPTRKDQAWALEVAAEVVPDFRIMRPGSGPGDPPIRPDPKLSAKCDDPAEEEAYELMCEGGVAIIEEAESAGEMPTRDQAKDIARRAMQKYRTEDYKGRKHASKGDMIHPPETEEE